MMIKEFLKKWEMATSRPDMSTANIHVFRSGIRPIWEDPQNIEGGKWVVTLTNEQYDITHALKLWLYLIIAILCGKLENPDDLVI
jgi:translation initiation factor 4E